MKIEKWNDHWKYWEEKDAFDLVWMDAPKTETVTLPHDAMLKEKPDPLSPNGMNTGYRNGSVYYYSRKFIPEASRKDQTLMLRFDGIYMNAFVYVNAQPAARWEYGYTGFYVLLNDYLRYGEENEIRVIVRNSGIQNSRWYSGGGIYRDVWMLMGGSAYIRPDGTRILTERLLNGDAFIKWDAELINRGSGKHSVDLIAQVIDEAGTVVASRKSPLSLYGNENRKVSQRMTVQQAQLWDDRDPYLYHFRLVMMEGDDVLDVQEERFGVRTVSADSRNGLLVTGREVKLRGACIHHDSGILGAATFYDAEYRRIKTLKESGFNAIRMAHHPAAPVLLRACDELGMYVMDETFDTWTRCKGTSDYGTFFDKCWEKDVEAMVRKDYLHPSVILYSIGNEIPEIGTEEGSRIAANLSDKIHELNPEAITLASVNGLFALGDVLTELIGGQTEGSGGTIGNVNEFMAKIFGNEEAILCSETLSRRLDRLDAAVNIAGYNYMTCRYGKDRKDRPERVIVGSETYPRAIPENWKRVMENPGIIGDFVWTGWDYIGEAGIGVISHESGFAGLGKPFPCQLAGSGEVDITGFRNPASYLADVVFGTRTQPFLCVQEPTFFHEPLQHTPWTLTDAIESWSFPGDEGKPVHVEVYSGADTVELYVNDRLVGTQPGGAAAGYISRFETAYTPGTIRAVARTDGRATGSVELRTAGRGCRLTAEKEETAGDELTFVRLLHTDENGTVVTGEDLAYEILTEGEEADVYTGSGFHSPREMYTDRKGSTYRGRAQIIVRRAGLGKTKLRIRSRYGETLLEIG